MAAIRKEPGNCIFCHEYREHGSWEPKGKGKGMMRNKWGSGYNYLLSNNTFSSGVSFRVNWVILQSNQLQHFTDEETNAYFSFVLLVTPRQNSYLYAILTVGVTLKFSSVGAQWRSRSESLVPIIEHIAMKVTSITDDDFTYNTMYRVGAFSLKWGDEW